MKVAVFLPNWVGDAVMATPALRALRQRFVGARMIGILKPYVAGVLDGAPWLDDRILLDGRGPWSQRWPAVAWALRRENVDFAVLFPNSFRSALIAWLGKCQRRAGFVRYGRGPLLTDRLAPVRDSEGRFTPTPVIDSYNRIAKILGCPRPGYRMELFTTPAEEQSADVVWEKYRLRERQGVVCLNPGAAFGAAKFWPTEYFSQLARSLAVRQGCAVLVLCGPADRDIAREIVAGSRYPAVHSLGDFRLSLGLTKACIRRCDLLVTTDSGPRHFGVAFDRPTLTLFGPTHVEWTETYHAKSVHLQKKLDCGPCQRRVCPLGHHRCMTELTPAEVLNAAEDLLRRFPEVQPKPLVARSA